MFDFSGSFGNGDWGVTIGAGGGGVYYPGSGGVYYPGGTPPVYYPPQQFNNGGNQILMLGLVVLAFLVLSKR